MKKSLSVAIFILLCLGMLISLGMKREVYSENESGAESITATSYLNDYETNMFTYDPNHMDMPSSFTAN